MRWWRCWLRSCSAGTRFSLRKPTDSSVGFLQDSVPEAHDPPTSKFRVLGEEASSWRRTSLFGRDFPLRERLSSSGETFRLGAELSAWGGTFLLGRDFPPGGGTLRL